MLMHCNQCEQTTKGVCCVKIGTCGKDPKLALAQDELVAALIAAAPVVEANAANAALFEKALFATLTNVNFDCDKIDARYPAKPRFLSWGALVCAAVCLLFHPMEISLWGVLESLTTFAAIYGMLLVKRETGNAWGDWDTEKFTAEDSAFGFVVMKNGAVIYLKSSWALNMADPREAITTICGDKGGADMINGLRLNTVLGGKQVIITPDLGGASVAFFDGAAGGAPEDLESACFTNAILGKGKLYVTADQAAVVTHILEGIYESDKTGKPYYFD